MKLIHVIVEVDVNPTEDLDKVTKAVTNFFPAASIDVTSGGGKRRIIATSEGREGLAELHSRLRQERIMAAARRVLWRGTQGRSITFYLNKQVAYVQRISFCEPVGESPLGPLEVTIRCDDPHEVIDWLTRDASNDRASR